MPKIVYFFLSLFLFNSCNNTDTLNNFASSKIVKSNVVIDLQPFKGITSTQTSYVFIELKKHYANIEIKKTIALPQSAWYPPRNRYRADSLIDFLKKRTANGHTTIGLTNKDISTTKGNAKDWGVMGLGYCPGNACIASTFRLSKKETNVQLFKVAIHELGHTFGLPHCDVKSCFMRDAEGGNPTNEEKEFCKKCKSYLLKKGWNLN